MPLDIGGLDGRHQIVEAGLVYLLPMVHLHRAVGRADADDGGGDILQQLEGAIAHDFRPGDDEQDIGL